MTDILQQLVEGSDRTSWNDIAEDLLLTVNEAVFDGELPLDRIEIEIIPRGGKKNGAIVTHGYRNGDNYYTITMYIKRFEQCSWKENTATLEHECLHIWLHEQGFKYHDKDKDFIYWAGKKDIILYYSEHIK